MSRTILLADDSLTIQKVVELTFADTDYEVVAVSSGDELLQKLPGSNADLVICDVIMPGRDGYDVCHEIKSNPDSLHLPVILLTGTFEPFDRDRALAVGCSEIITKPFEARKLVDAVNRLATEDGGAPLAAPATKNEGQLENEGQVTPPVPMMVPENLSSFEDELQDTAVSAEFGPGPEEEIETNDLFDSGPAVPQADEPSRDTVDFAAPAEDVEFDLVENAQTTEIEVPADPPNAVPIGPSEAEIIHDAADTVSDRNIAEIMDETENEVFAEQPVAMDDDVFPSDTSHEEPFQTEEPELPTPPVSQFETDHSKTTPINVSSVMAEVPVHDEISEFEFDAATDEVAGATTQEIDDISDADTQDFDETPCTEDISNDEMSNAATQDITEVEETPAVAVPAGDSASSLSDEDVDRIARRVVELSRDRIEHIAWSVIPDMAEIVVRERVREIEEKAGGEPG